MILDSRVLVLRGDSDQKEVLVDLAITYFGIFGFELNAGATLDEGTKEDIKRLLVVNATAIVLPYLRSAVTVITADTGIFPPIVLPIINVAAMIDETKKEVTFED